MNKKFFSIVLLAGLLISQSQQITAANNIKVEAGVIGVVGGLLSKFVANAMRSNMVQEYGIRSPLVPGLAATAVAGLIVASNNNTEKAIQALVGILTYAALSSQL